MRSGAVVRALASHQCGAVSNPGVDAILVCRLSLLLVLVLAPRGFSPCISIFPLLKKKQFQIPFRSGTHGHVSTTSWELLNTPWVKKCQITIFLLVPNLYPSPSLYSGICLWKPRMFMELEKRLCSHGHHFFCLLSQCLFFKKNISFHALGNYVYSAPSFTNWITSEMNQIRWRANNHFIYLENRCK